MSKVLAIAALFGLLSLAGCYSPYYRDHYDRPYGYYNGYYSSDGMDYGYRPYTYDRDDRGGGYYNQNYGQQSGDARDQSGYDQSTYDQGNYGYVPKSGYNGPDVNPDAPDR